MSRQLPSAYLRRLPKGTHNGAMFLLHSSIVDSFRLLRVNAGAFHRNNLWHWACESAATPASCAECTEDNADLSINKPQLLPNASVIRPIALMQDLLEEK